MEVVDVVLVVDKCKVVYSKLAAVQPERKLFVLDTFCEDHTIIEWDYPYLLKKSAGRENR